TKNDSITRWIDSSLNDTLTPYEKQILLFKAFDRLKKFPDDSLKMMQLSKLSYYSIDTEDSLFFRTMNNETILLSEKLKDSLALGEASWDLALYFDKINTKDSALFYYNKTIIIFSNLKNQSKVGKLLLSMGITQREIGDYAGAEISTIKAIAIFKALDDKKRLSDGYNSLGAITTSLGNHQRAIEFFEISNTLMQKVSNNGYANTQIINNIGVAYKALGQFKNAEDNFKKVLATDSLKIKEPSFYAKTLTNLANTKLDLKTSENLEPLYQEAILLLKNTNNEFNEATSTGYFSNYLVYKKDTIAAISYAQKARALAETSENTQSLLRTLDLLTRIDPKNATEYAQEYFTVNTKLQEEERQLRDKFARVRFQTDEFIERNQLLSKQNELLEREKYFWTVFALFSFLAVIAVLIIVIQRIKNKNLRFEQQQQEANQEIFNLLMNQQKKLTEGKKIAQERIAQELHDGVLNDILGIRLILSHFNKKNDEASISYRAELIEQLAAVSEDIRTVSHELDHKSHQKVYNFIESIKTLIEKFKTATHTIKYEFTYPKNFDWDATNVDIKINLYRILQESIQNAIKHAQPKNIFINFDALENTIRATIEDDGNGFDTKKLKKGIGVKNIASRLKKLNGEWKIESTLGKGTSTIIKIPLVNSKVP
ncbi:MAG: ATP-binding protein, partial [Cellulophaga sp.]|nr:ATP-binding protein [Cellulophaga sp.]